MNSIVLALGALVALIALYEIKKHVENTKDKSPKLDMLFFRTCGVVFWPLVFHTLVSKDSQKDYKLLFPFLWPILMWMVDSYLIIYGQPSKNSLHKVATIRVEPSVICSMTFALYGLVGGNLSQKHSHIFMYAILACIAFAFPSHNLDPGSKEEQVIEAFQRTITTFCTGLMFTGVALNRIEKNKVEENKNE
jgi:hypothetical protein